jgi:flagellar basal body-associated protein FliL
MAEKNEKAPAKEVEAAAAPVSRSKKGVALGGGVAAAIGLAYLTFLMAVPKVEKHKVLAGPFVAELTEPGNDISVNLSGRDERNFLGIGVRAEYAAYDEAYVVARTLDPLYKAMLDHQARLLLSDKTKAEISGKTGKEILTQELREAIDPILFPVHVGKTKSPSDAEPESGLRAGLSTESATWRGLFHEHVLHVDGPDRTLALDAGAKVTFRVGDDDVRIVDAEGDAFYVDTSGLNEKFVGDVNVGVMGKIRKIYFSSFISQ